MTNITHADEAGAATPVRGNAAMSRHSEFDALQAEFKRLGHTLGRAFDANTGRARYYACKWGYIKHMADLDDVHAFLKQIGGQHHGV